jgi:glycosyltransferase involved in cell wall biosynthesis
MKTLICLPTYNEAENIALLLPQLLELPVDICVVDDGSPDGTGRIADEWAAREPRVRVIHRTGKLGLGTAYIAGFKAGLAADYDAVMTMDADFSHHPRYIPAMLKALADADLVIGSRYVRGGEVRYPWHRRMLSRISNFVARLLLGYTAHDCTAGFRLYRSAVLRAMPLDHIFSNGYSFLTETMWHVQRSGFRIAEVPIIFEDRVLGQSKISSREIYRGMTTVGRLFLRRLRGAAGGRTD